MKIGIPKEIKPMEMRVAITPAGVNALHSNGHLIIIEKNAGLGSGITDEDYQAAGAKIAETAEEVWDAGDMIVKVKEPVSIEYERMRARQLLFTYLHLAADPALTHQLIAKRVTAVAYETVQQTDGSLPLLAPMSEVAGRLAVQMGCFCLEAKNKGRGLLLSGVPGVPPANVTIIGGGISGINAAHLAVGMGARVTILDIDLKRLRYLEDIFHSRITTMMSNSENIKKSISDADLVIGALLIPGARAPRLISREMIAGMKQGAAFVDIAIDQGGCSETSRPTTHENPVYIEDGVVHYCVTNMPGAVPATSTYALTNVTLPLVREIADKGGAEAIAKNPLLATGLNVFNGALTHPRVAESLQMECAPSIH